MAEQCAICGKKIGIMDPHGFIVPDGKIKICYQCRDKYKC